MILSTWFYGLSVGSSIAGLKTLVDLVKGLGDVAGAANKFMPPWSDNLCKALRHLYFYDGEVLGVLRAMERGEDVSELRNKIDRFTDAELQVQEAIHQLSTDNLKNDLKLNLSQIRNLSQIVHLKLGVRSKILGMTYGYPETKISKPKLKQLIKQIEELNSAIEEAEQIINQRLRTAH